MLVNATFSPFPIFAAVQPKKFHAIVTREIEEGLQVIFNIIMYET